MLTIALMLTIPNDLSGFIIYCDAYRLDLGCVLKQHYRAVAHGSR